MAYIRKTTDEWHILSDYGCGYGLECIGAYDNCKEAKIDMMCYRKNTPQYSYKLVTKRIPKSEVTNNDKSI
jgi:hypothetical protein